MPSYIRSQANAAQFFGQIALLHTGTEALQNQVTSLPNQVDQYGNTITLYGNLNVTILVGGTATQTGVYVGTGLAATPGQPTTPGIAVVKNLATTTITTTAGSPTATLASASGFSTNMMIGAAQVAGVSAIVPGTYIKNLVSTTVTLSINAAESGTSLYCAAVNVYAVTSYSNP